MERSDRNVDCLVGGRRAQGDPLGNRGEPEGAERCLARQVILNAAPLDNLAYGFSRDGVAGHPEGASGPGVLKEQSRAT